MSCTGCAVCWPQTSEKVLPARELNAIQRKYFNVTRNGNQLRTTGATPDTTSKTRELKNDYGLLVSSASTYDVHVYGVKSDKGTCDSFQALPLTYSSTEFVVSVWK